MTRLHVVNQPQPRNFAKAIDTVANTLELPPHRHERLFELLSEMSPAQQRVSVKKWHKMLGELRLMTLAIPGARGLFSHVQAAFKTAGSTGRIQVTRHVHAALDDFRWLADNLDARPTRLQELAATHPEVHGTTDSSGKGMGGVVLEPSAAVPRRNAPESGHPILWRDHFPSDVIADLVTCDNPHGRTTNSNLELAATVIQHDITCQHCDARERTAHTGTDNTPALCWQHKGSVSANGTPAHLL